MRQTILAMLAVACLAVGCEEAPVGLAPGQYCYQLNEITHSASADCPEVQGRIREERPEEYACMSRCVEPPTDVATLQACATACRALP